MSNGTLQKCHTCFAMVDRSLPRCPKCGAHQTWRRHITLSNGVLLILAGTMVAVVVIGSRLLSAANEHGSSLTCTKTISTGDKIRAHVTVSNTGDRPCVISWLTVEFKDGNGVVGMAQLSQDEAHEMTVTAGGILNKTVVLMPCPGSVEIVALHLFVRHFDGRFEKMDLPGGLAGSCSKTTAHT